jgi:mono/diheme cytochrome c family protein
MKWFLSALVFVSLSDSAATATLEIVSGGQKLSYSQSQLLSRPDVQTLSIADSVYKQRFTRFKAIPIGSLFKRLTIPSLAVVQSNSTDGFSAILDRTRLFNTDPKTSKAYLAIEDPGRPWPPLAFYLVWKDPQVSRIGREEWPYQIASFHILTDPRAVFPKAYPAADASMNVQDGFRSFQKNCFACHKMSGDGAGTIGPDLNLPMNPTEYLEPKSLARLIRRPANVRSWPGMTMSGFSEAAIPDDELADLIAYLKYMSGKRGKS